MREKNWILEYWKIKTDELECRANSSDELYTFVHNYTCTNVRYYGQRWSVLMRESKGFSQNFPLLIILQVVYGLFLICFFWIGRQPPVSQLVEQLLLFAIIVVITAWFLDMPRALLGLSLWAGLMMTIITSCIMFFRQMYKEMGLSGVCLGGVFIVLLIERWYEHF
jgi:hypothetical protein